MTAHGGNIYSAARESGIPEEKIIDFSASINPLGLPLTVVAEIREEIRNLPNYPAPYAEPLASYLSEYLGVERESIICGNGSTELIYLVVRALKPAKALIPAPTFSEYERACEINNASMVIRHESKRKNNFDIDPERFIQAMKGCNLAFLCNPNNPTGRLIGKKELMRIADAAERMKCHLVVDEAFIDFCSGASVIDEVPGNPYLVVLRSLTKFYALSGLRVGYGVFHPAVTGLIMAHKEPWTVNTLAQRAGIVALKDEAYKKQSLTVMGQEKRFMEKSLADLGITFIPSSANYYLLEMEDAREVVSLLKRKGFLVRDCSNFEGLDETYIRIAVKSRKDNAALIKELSFLCRG